MGGRASDPPGELAQPRLLAYNSINEVRSSRSDHNSDVAIGGEWKPGKHASPTKILKGGTGSELNGFRGQEKEDELTFQEQEKYIY